MTAFPTILLVEDEPEVAHALAASLASLEQHFPLELASSAEDALDVVDKLTAHGKTIGLVLCDHRLPGREGLLFLVDLLHRPDTARARKVLLTGEADLRTTLPAFHQAGLDQCLTKPWDNRELIAICRHLLTDFVLETAEDLTPYLGILDTERLNAGLRQRAAVS